MRANREKALLSHIRNFTREAGYIDLPNPCAGIAGFRETGRDTYIEDAQYTVIRSHADARLRDAMDLAYLAGQRPADALRLVETDIRVGSRHVVQSKTGKKLRILVTDELAAVLSRIREAQRQPGRSSVRMTEHYARNRAGAKVTPTR